MHWLTVSMTGYSFCTFLLTFFFTLKHLSSDLHLRLNCCSSLSPFFPSTLQPSLPLPSSSPLLQTHTHTFWHSCILPLTSCFFFSREDTHLLHLTPTLLTNKAYQRRHTFAAEWPLSSLLTLLQKTHTHVFLPFFLLFVSLSQANTHTLKWLLFNTDRHTTNTIPLCSLCYFSIYKATK